jgi:hypothetical protein
MASAANFATLCGNAGPPPLQHRKIAPARTPKLSRSSASVIGIGPTGVAFRRSLWTATGVRDRILAAGRNSE